MLIKGTDGIPIAMLTASDKGSSLHLNDPKGNTKLMLVVNGNTGLGEISLFADDKSTIWKVPETANIHNH